MKLILQPLILTALLAGTIALQPSSCAAKALFEWPGSKKAKSSNQVPAVDQNQRPNSNPGTVAAPAPQTGRPLWTSAPSAKPPADPDWPEIDLQTLEKPKAKVLSVKKIWPLSRKSAKTEVQPVVQPAAQGQTKGLSGAENAQVPTTKPTTIPTTITPAASAFPRPAAQAMHPLDPSADWPEIEVDTSAVKPQNPFTHTTSEMNATRSTEPTTGSNTSPNISNTESSIDTEIEEKIGVGKTKVQTNQQGQSGEATASGASQTGSKAQPVVKMPLLMPQSKTTSAFRASAAHSLALREVAKAVHIHKTPTTERIVIASDSIFDRDQATISPTGEMALAKLAERTEQWQEHPVIIECHCDNFGFDTFIRKLSQQRADCLRLWFLRRDLMQEIQVKATGVGKDRPLAPNQKAGKDDPVGMAINRRVEIFIDKTKAIEVPVISEQPQAETDMNRQQVEQTASSNAGSAPNQTQNTNNDPSFGDASLILDQLPRLEDLKPHAGRTSDFNSEPDRAPEGNSPEKIREHEWEQKEFGLWREHD